MCPEGRQSLTPTDPAELVGSGEPPKVLEQKRDREDFGLGQSSGEGGVEGARLKAERPVQIFFPRGCGLLAPTLCGSDINQTLARCQPGTVTRAGDRPKIPVALPL